MGQADVGGKRSLLRMLSAAVMGVRMIPRLALIVFVSLLTGCGGEVDLSSMGAQPLTITRYKNGAANEELRVLPPSGVHEGLTAWAAQHTKGWKRSYVSYAPGILVRGTNFSLNILPSGVVLNFGGKQYVRDGGAGDFGFLREDGGYVVSEQERAKWPRSVAEAVKSLIAELSEEEKTIIREMAKEDLIKFHHGWGMGIRNEFGLWRGNDELFKDTGAEDPDGASMAIIKAVWEELRMERK
jgi:hypothetical protein